MAQASGGGCPIRGDVINDDANASSTSRDDGTHVRTRSKSDYGLAIEPLLPFHELYFVPTVFIVGTSMCEHYHSFVLYRPNQEAHFSHRQRQVGKQLREAQMETQLELRRCRGYRWR